MQFLPPACSPAWPTTLKHASHTHPSAAAAGKTVPPSADVKQVTALICSDPEAAGDQIRTAVDKGGAAAQVRAGLCGAGRGNLQGVGQMRHTLLLFPAASNGVAALKRYTGTLRF